MSFGEAVFFAEKRGVFAVEFFAGFFFEAARKNRPRARHVHGSSAENFRDGINRVETVFAHDFVEGVQNFVGVKAGGFF